MKAKKLLFIIDLISGGGAAKVLKIAMKVLKDSEFDVELAVLKKSQNELDFSEFKVTYLLDNEDKLLPNSFFILDKLRELIIDKDFICTFIDFITVYYVSLAFRLNQIEHKTGQKLFCFVRSTLLLLSESFEYQKLNIDLSKLALNCADKVIVNSLFCLKELKSLGIKTPILLRNPAVLNTTKKDLILPKNYCVAVGRLSLEKDYETMIKAFKMAKCKDLKLLILGEGEDKFKARNVEFVGHAKEIFSYLKGAKFFVQTSLFEGSSNSVLESYMVGLPAILSDIEQNREIYKDNAIYVKPKDILGFSNAIKKLNKKCYSFDPRLDEFSIDNFKKNLLKIFK